MEVRERIFASALGVLVAGGIIRWLQDRSQTFPLSALIDTGAVSALAQNLPQEKNEFAWAAWNMVGSQVAYSYYGSILQMVDHSVNCERCLLPRELLAMDNPKANCVGKAALLVSLLRNRFPPGEVYMVVGRYAKDGRYPGHAWAELFKDGQWYIIEATVPPTRWMPVSEVEDTYLPEAFINDVGSRCATEKCLMVDPAACPCLFDH